MPLEYQPSVPGTVQTRASLISRLRNLDDRDSWQDFFDTYWKLIYSVARKAGLSEPEAEEVVQETTVAVSKYIEDYRYDPKVCSFKNWLLHKTRWRIIDQVRKRQPDFVQRFATATSTSHVSILESVPNPESLEWAAIWNDEWQKNLVDAAIERVKRRIKPVHYQIFHLSVVRNLSPLKIAATLNVNVAQVYLVRHRVSALVKKEVRVLETRDF